MISAGQKVVYDCNIYVQAMINSNGPAGVCVGHALSGRVTLVLSEFVLDEIRRAYLKKTPARLGITAARTEAMAQSVLAVGQFLQAIPSRFTYSRDPDDAHYVNLALAAQANLIISRDNDLLSLTDPANTEGASLLQSFSDLRILDPVQFLRELAATSD